MSPVQYNGTLSSACRDNPHSEREHSGHTLFGQEGHNAMIPQCGSGDDRDSLKKRNKVQMTCLVFRFFFVFLFVF